VILSASAILDIYHLAGPYHRLWGTPNPFWQNIKSAELCEAYGILQRSYFPDGKGFLLSELRANPTDQTLTVAAYPFDAGRNPSISPGEIKWVGLIANANDKPFLSRKFPMGHWYGLSKAALSSNQPQMLGVIPLDPRTAPDLGRWMRADRELQPLTDSIMDAFRGQDQEPFLKALFESYPSLRGDPFLESCFWEKVVFHLMAAGDEAGALKALQQGVKKGYPAAHLFNMEGVLLAKEGKVHEARMAFQKAIRCEINLTPALENLRALVAVQ